MNVGVGGFANTDTDGGFADTDTDITVKISSDTDTDINVGRSLILFQDVRLYIRLCDMAQKNYRESFRIFQVGPIIDIVEATDYLPICR